jgi:hypothetical protein
MKGKIFNAYTGFVLGVIFIAAITFVQLPCPACGGSGVVKGVLGLEVTGVEAKLVDHIALGVECGWDYERYNYDVKVSVTNKSNSPSFGVIMVTFHDPDETITLVQEKDDEEVISYFSGETLEAFPFPVEVGPNRTEVFEKRVMFSGVTLEMFSAEAHLVEAIAASEFECPYGKKVPFTEWLRLRGLK